MLTCENLFEIPVYRLNENSYYDQMKSYISEINGKNQHPMDEVYLKKQYGGDWKYNEIIGFLGFYRYGENQIRCEYWETNAKKKVLTRIKQFEKISDSYCLEPFSKSAENSILAQSMRNAVEHCETRLKKKKRVLDRELFDRIVNHVNWKSLLNKA
jgi:hypothetical protein